MANTQNFRNQHKALLALAGEMASLMTPVGGAKRNADDLRRLLSKLAGQLSVHLAMEDESLYPRLIAGTDARVSELARRYQQEMGGLAGAFKAFCDKYPTAAAIEQNSEAFKSDASGVFDAVARRIQREDSELYALVDSLKGAR